MKAKVILVLAGMGALGGLMYGINRLSTQLHPYGNWILLVIALIVVAVIAAQVWQWYEDDQARR